MPEIRTDHIHKIILMKFPLIRKFSFGNVILSLQKAHELPVDIWLVVMHLIISVGCFLMNPMYWRPCASVPVPPASAICSIENWKFIVRLFDFFIFSKRSLLMDNKLKRKKSVQITTEKREGCLRLKSHLSCQR